MAGTVKACSCSLNSNFGTIDCPNLFDVAYKVVYVPYFLSDGTVNGLDLSSDPTLNKAYFDALVNDAQNVAWRPTPEVLNFDSERGEQEYQEFNDGLVKLPTQKGIRPVKFVLAGVSPDFVAKFDGMNCDVWGFYIIDRKGNLIGINSGYKTLNPIRIQNRSISGQFVMAKYKGVQEVMVTFNVDSTVKDSDLGSVNYEDMTYDLTTIEPLIDADIVLNTHISQTSTGFAIVVDTKQGSVINPSLIEGLVKADFTLVNTVSGATITITTVTETKAGYYTFVVPSQTTGVVYKLSAVSAGFNINSLNIVGV